MKGKTDRQKFFKMLGNAILLASIQASIGSCEMSSKYSVVNFSKDQETLQNASNALTGYLVVALIWTIGSTMISYGQYGIPGLITSIIANLVLIAWLFFSYIAAFKTAADRYGLEFPRLFEFTLSSSPP